MFDSFAGTDVRKTVRLRGLAFNGAVTGTIGIRILGTTGAAGSAVFVENTLIDGNFAGTARGISDERSGGGELTLTNVTVRNNGGTGITVAGGATRLDATFDNVHVHNSNFGIAVGNNVKLSLNNSVSSGNTLAGLFVDVGGDATVDNSVFTNNGTGVQNSATVRLSDATISYNTTGINGSTASFGTNRIVANGSAGTVPTLIGGVATNPFGQQ